MFCAYTTSEGKAHTQNVAQCVRNQASSETHTYNGNCQIGGAIFPIKKKCFLKMNPNYDFMTFNLSHDERLCVKFPSVDP